MLGAASLRTAAPVIVVDFVIVVVIVVAIVIVIENISSDQIDIQMFPVLPSFVLRCQMPEKPLEDSQETGRLTKLFVLQQNKKHNSNQ